MRKMLITLVVVVTGLLAMAASTSGVAAKTPGPPWQISLSGAAEPAGGDPDGSGVATLRLNYGASTLCWNASWENIDAPSAGHIHVGPVGVAGPVVIPFTDAAGVFTASGCRTVDQALLKAIKANPAGYYVNLHNAAFPAGVIRGQLTSPPVAGP
jgi:hypothetical protein